MHPATEAEHRVSVSSLHAEVGFCVLKASRRGQCPSLRSDSLAVKEAVLLVCGNHNYHTSKAGIYFTICMAGINACIQGLAMDDRVCLLV